MAAAACGGGASPPAPPEIAYGMDLCSLCGMSVDDPRFAVVAVAADGTHRSFDDIGCLLRATAGDERVGARIWVHDYHGGGWLDGRAARFVRTAELATPMGSGLAACATVQAAADFSRLHAGEELRWDPLQGSLGPVESAR